ncbi:unnamed protein product [Rotaria sp. Silwood1]|nr:unnamed protein product [Rotaria sp. Silwood1]
MNNLLIPFCLLISIVDGQNCSVYNPCGRNDYCRDTNGKWRCECKFWWNDTLCDEPFRGDESEIPRRHRSEYVSYSSGNVYFGGYFIDYLLWGYILVAFFTMLIWVCFEVFITFGSARWIQSILKLIIPTVLAVFCKEYINEILSRYVCLQYAGQVLAINNRRILMIFIYFNIFLDAFLGFVSSIIRLLQSVVAEIIYMCRLDYSPLGRKLELFDGDFNAYCGYIRSECAHRHLVMLVFASHLFNQLKMKQYE